MAMDTKEYCVYAHINKINGKMYIGQTCNKLKVRWKNGEGYKGSICFYSAIKKYGWDNFEHEIIASHLTKEEANNFEKLLIKALKTQSKQYGYNVCDGGNTQNSMQGKKLSEEHRQKIRESKLGEKNPMYGVRLYGEKNGMYGKHHSEEWKQKMREMYSGENSPFYGRHHTDETKKQLSEMFKEKYQGENNPFYGKRHTDATKEKIRNAAKKRTNNKIPVVQLDDFGKLIKEWDCMASANKALDICRGCIAQCLNGRCKHAGGYRWMLAKEYYDTLNLKEKIDDLNTAK